MSCCSSQDAGVICLPVSMLAVMQRKCKGVLIHDEVTSNPDASKLLRLIPGNVPKDNLSKANYVGAVVVEVVLEVGSLA